MNKLHRLSAIILAVVMIASLTACAGKNADSVEETSSTEAAAQAESQPKDVKSGSREATDTNTQVGENKSNSDRKILDLSHASFDEVNPFSEGLAWVIHKGQIKVVSKKGEVIFKTDSSSYETDIPLPFHDGVSCYNIGKDFFIIDKDGNTLYQTKEYKDDDYDEILAYGDGGFLVHRFSKGFKDGKKTGGHSLGLIDKNGKDISEFTSVDFTPERKWEHLCDGVFYEPLNGKVFDSKSGKCSSVNNDINCIGNETDSVSDTPNKIVSENGKVWVELSSLQGLGIMDVHTLEIQKFECKNDTHTYIIDDIGVVDGVYYNLRGEKVAEISAYLPNVIRRGNFSDTGLTPLVLLNGSSYITYVDKNGKDQFDPMKLGSESSYTKDYFVNSEGTLITVYDNTGKEHSQVSVIDPKDLRLYDDYFIAGKNYYFI